jgi:hypothetical protein
MDDEDQGGFLPSTLISPPHSSLASSPATPKLPHPREHPLKPGSAKESTLIRFVDESIMKIQRRFARRGSEMENAMGYKSFAEVVKDFERIIDLLWLSGTRKSINLLIINY